MRESDIEYYLKVAVKRRDGYCFKLKFIGRFGSPDRLVILEGRHFLVEVKAPGKKAEDHQLRLHALLRWAGLEVYVIDSFELVDEVLCQK